MAALHARVRDARRSAPESAPLIARVTALQDHLGLMHDADVAASMARAFLVEHAGDLSSLESAAIGRYLVNREREVARLRRTIAAPWRGVDGLAFRRAPRPGGRRPLAASRVGQTRQPWASSGSRSRQARPACAAARIAPSRIPASDTRSDVGAVVPQDRVDDDGARPAGSGPAPRGSPWRFAASAAGSAASSASARAVSSRVERPLRRAEADHLEQVRDGPADGDDLAGLTPAAPWRRPVGASSSIA